MQKTHFDGEKYLTVKVPWELVKDGFIEEIDAEAMSALVNVACGAAQKIGVSTTSGGVTIHLSPSSYGFAPDFDSVGGKPAIAFNANGGDGHWTCGDKASTLNADTVSGNLNLD